MSKITEVLERLATVEAAVAKLGHNGGPPLDDDEPHAATAEAQAKQAVGLAA